MAKQARILAGKTVAITGGARGIGQATAQALVARGMRVAIGDLDLATAQATASTLGPSVVAIALDVTDRDSFTAFLDEAEQQLGPIDVLINNAGIMQIGRFVDEDDLTARRMVDINVHGVLLGMKLALARMIPRDRGHIVNIASQAGKFASPGGATYSATKHAVVGLTEAVRGELSQMGVHIDVSYVLPYAVNTELGTGLANMRGSKQVQPSDVAEAIVDALQTGIVDVWVPRSTKHLVTFGSVLPRRVYETIGHLLKADRVLAGADLAARRAYELRASSSEPALTSSGEQPQIAKGTAE